MDRSSKKADGSCPPPRDPDSSLSSSSSAAASSAGDDAGGETAVPASRRRGAVEIVLGSGPSPSLSPGFRTATLDNLGILMGSGPSPPLSPGDETASLGDLVNLLGQLRDWNSVVGNDSGDDGGDDGKPAATSNQNDGSSAAASTTRSEDDGLAISSTEDSNAVVGNDGKPAATSNQNDGSSGASFDSTEAPRRPNDEDANVAVASSTRAASPSAATTIAREKDPHRPARRTSPNRGPFPPAIRVARRMSIGGARRTSPEAPQLTARRASPNPDRLSAAIRAARRTSPEAPQLTARRASPNRRTPEASATSAVAREEGPRRTTPNRRSIGPAHPLSCCKGGCQGHTPILGHRCGRHDRRFSIGSPGYDQGCFEISAVGQSNGGGNQGKPAARKYNDSIVVTTSDDHVHDSKNDVIRLVQRLRRENQLIRTENKQLLTENKELRTENKELRTENEEVRTELRKERKKRIEFEDALNRIDLFHSQVSSSATLQQPTRRPDPPAAAADDDDDDDHHRESSDKRRDGKEKENTKRQNL